MKPLLLLVCLAIELARSEGNDVSIDLKVGEEKIITSVKFPEPYPKNIKLFYRYIINCKYDYAASVVFSCPYFSLPFDPSCGVRRKHDFLEVKDFMGLNRIYCGRSGPQNDVSGGTTLTVIFRTDGKRPGRRGFNCTAKCVHMADKTTVTTTPGTTVSKTTHSTTTPIPTTPPPTPAVGYDHCSCGIPDGNKYPWVCYLTRGSRLLPECHAIVLNNKYLLTLASCVQSNTNQCEYLSLVCYDFDLGKIGDFKRFRIEHTKIHPGFNNYTNDHNIAILETNKPINLSYVIKPVCIPSANDDFNNQSGKVSGWWPLFPEGCPNDVLQKYNVTVMNCVNDSTLCPVSSVQMNATCVVGKGEPLTVKVDGRYFLAGISAGLKQCGGAASPTFLKISKYAGWINAAISSGKTCLNETATSTMMSSSSSSSASSVSSVTTLPTTAQALIVQCDCGIRTGDTSKPLLANPWTLLIYRKSANAVWCSGVHLNTLHVLTASSCVSGVLVSDVEIHANVENIATGDPGRIQRNAVKIVIHDELAIIELEIPYSQVAHDGIKPACLPAFKKNFSGYNGSQSGFGSNCANNMLKAHPGRIVDCNGALCFEPNSGYQLCGVDKGGPVVSSVPHGISSYYMLVGIVTEATGSGNQTMAGISKYFDWIVDNTKVGRYCKTWAF